jgi:hypothetical protein
MSLRFFFNICINGKNNTKLIYLVLLYNYFLIQQLNIMASAKTSVDNGSLRIHNTEKLTMIFTPFGNSLKSAGDILRLYAENVIWYSDDDAFVAAARDILRAIEFVGIDKVKRGSFCSLNVIVYTTSKDKPHNAFSHSIIKSVLEPWKRDGQPLSS